MSNSFSKYLRDKYIRCSESGGNVIRNKLWVPKKKTKKDNYHDYRILLIQITLVLST